MALGVYKKGQGTAARGVAGVVAILLGTWAGYSMWHYGTVGWPDWAKVLGTAVAVGLFGGVPVYLVLFHHQAVDILIETQQEMRKVAWSSRREVFGSTFVVIVTVIILSLFIFLSDQFVLLIFSRILHLYR